MTALQKFLYIKNYVVREKSLEPQLFSHRLIQSFPHTLKTRLQITEKKFLQVFFNTNTFESIFFVFLLSLYFNVRDFLQLFLYLQ